MSEKRDLSTQLKDRGVTSGQWHTLAKSLYPGAQIESVLMVIDYCRARGLDPMKKPCHIVPMDYRDGDTWKKRDVVMPGIYEYRTTAQKTGEYMGHSKPEYGDLIDFKGVEAPEWCSITVYRWNEASGQKVDFPVTVWFSEIVALTYDKKQGEHVVNSRWSRAPRQMLTKCTEAAALREAFPDELGGEMTFEEMVDQPPIDGETHTQFTMSKQAVTKVINAMNEAIDKGDPSAVWEIYMEQSEEEWGYIQSKMDRWRAKEWETALKEAAEHVREASGDYTPPEAREKDTSREAARASA